MDASWCMRRSKDGGVEVPQGPGLGADPEDDPIAQFRA